MKIDRSRFLALTLSIATATMAATGCSSEPAASGDDELDSAVSGACFNGDGPGASYQEGLCLRVGLQQEWGRDQCGVYRNQLKPATSARALACLEKALADDRLESMEIYDCGKKALANTCADPWVDPLCYTIMRTAEEKGHPTSLKVCERYLSGLRDPARRQVQECVNGPNFVGFYSCIEGLEDREPSEMGEDGCYDADAVAPAPYQEGFCSRAASEDQGIASFLQNQCEVWHYGLKPMATQQAMDCISTHMEGATKLRARDMYECGQAALTKACADPSVDGYCKRIVAAQGNNRNYPATQAECTKYLSGMNERGREAMARCAEGRDFYGIWSCAEGLDL